MSKPVLLCVDDERFVLAALKEQLVRQFADEFLIETVESGEEALEVLGELLASGTTVPVLISDQMMPGMRGEELLIAAHQRTPDTLSIMLTGQASADAVGAALNCGCLYRYVAKPWAEDDLMQTVRTALATWRQTQELAKRDAELQATFAVTQRFVPNELLQLLGHDHIRGLKLGDQVERHMSVMFCDIRSFTSISEQMDPASNFSFINDLLSVIGPVIRSHRGFVDKYLGDAVMAVFPGEADDAVRAAVKIHRAIEEFNGSHTQRLGFEVRAGVGVHTGTVMLGIVGEPQRWNGTVISDTVNVAARLESLSKNVGARVLVSEATLRHTTGRYHTRPLGPVAVRGKQQAVAIAELLDAEGAAVQTRRTATRGLFDAGIAALAAGEIDNARQAFHAVLAADPDDRAVSYLLARC